MRSTPLVARFCTQNGWIDETTLEFEVQAPVAGEALVSVRFEEIVVKAAGCVGRRVPCFGRLRLRLDADGGVSAAAID